MDVLPLEILDKVQRLLDVNSKLKLRCTCTQLFELIDHNDFIIYCARSEKLPEMARVFSRYKTPISLTFTKTISLNTKAINRLSTVINLTSLKFDTSYGFRKAWAMSGIGRLTNLRSISFDGQYSIYPDILAPLNNLTHISLRTEREASMLKTKQNLLSVELLQLLHFSVIQHLGQVTSLMVDFMGSGADSIKDLERATNLRSLEIKFDYHHGTPSQQQFQTALQTLTALRSLHIASLPDPDVGHCTNLTKLELYRVCMTQSNTAKWTALTNLQSLSYHSPDITKDDFSFFTVLSKLNHYCSDMSNDHYYLNKIRSDSLTSLKITASESVEKHITLFTALQKLIIVDNMDDLNYGFLTALAQLTHFETTSSRVSRETLTSVKHLTAIKTLMLTCNAGATDYNFVHYDFRDLAQLEVLDVFNLSHKAFESLKGLTKLTSLTVPYRLHIAPEALETLTALKVFRIANNAINDDDWNVVLKLTKLESLRCGFLEKGIETRIYSLTALPHLTGLWIHSSFKHFNYRWFFSLTNLQKLIAPFLQPKQGKKLQRKLPYLWAV